MQSLSPVSQLLMRNESRLRAFDNQQVLLVNPPADHLVIELFKENNSKLSIHTTDYHSYKHINNISKESNFEINFSDKIEHQNLSAPNLAIIFLPKEKPLLDYLLAQTLGVLAPEGKVWLLGENKSGIKSAAKRLANQSGASVKKLDSARHCSLLETTVSNQTQKADDHLADHPFFELEFNQQQWKFNTLAGVFSKGRLDPGSRMLLDNILQQPLRKGRLLDMACGCGVLGICAASLQVDIQLDLLDVNAMALVSTKLNIQQSSIPTDNIRISASDIYSAADGRYDAIISNPPFHRDTRQTLAISQRLIQQAPLYLSAKGELRIVANRHLPYLAIFQQTFRQVEVLASDRFFQIIQGKIPFRYRT